jgi:predicted nucleic acid-binding protein
MIDSVVSNSSPLIVFSKLNILDLFKELYGKIYFPSAVYQETVIKGIKHGFEDANNLSIFLNKNNWNHTEIHEIPVPIISANLDKGEM